MSDQSKLNGQTTGLSGHILPTSATMIGVCVTLVGLAKLAEGRFGPNDVDEYAALSSIAFLASSLASYLSLRFSRRVTLSLRLERLADVIFIFSLVAITAVATLFAYEVI